MSGFGCGCGCGCFCVFLIMLVRVTQQVFRIETRCPHLQDEQPRKEFGTFFLLCRYTRFPLKLTCLQWTTIQLHWQHALWKKKKLIHRYAPSSRQHPMNISWRTVLNLNEPWLLLRSLANPVSLNCPSLRRPPLHTHWRTHPICVVGYAWIISHQ